MRKTSATRKGEPSRADSPTYQIKPRSVAVALLGIVISVCCMAGLDLMKQERPMSATLNVRVEYGKQLLNAKLKQLELEQPGKGEKPKQTQGQAEPVVPPAFTNWIRSFDEALQYTPSWRERMGEAGSALHHAYTLGVAVCIAVITVCGLYLLYALAYWAQIPVEKKDAGEKSASPEKREPSAGDDAAESRKAAPAAAAEGDLVSIAVKREAKDLPARMKELLSVTTAVGASSLIAISSVAMVAVAATVSTTLVLRQPDEGGKPPLPQPPGEGQPKPGEPPSNSGNNVLTFGPALPAEPQPLNLTVEIPEKKIHISPDPGWREGIQHFELATQNFKDSSANLLAVVEKLKPASGPTYDWSALEDKLKRLVDTNQKLTLVTAAVLGNDCYRQGNEARMDSVFLGVDAGQAGWLSRLSKEPCAIWAPATPNQKR